MAEVRTISARLLDPGGMAFEGHTPSGHTLALDASPEHGGVGNGASPMELYL